MRRTTSSLHRAHSRSSFNRLVFESEHCLGGGHDERSLVFRFFQLMVVVFRSITPFSYLYIAWIVCNEIGHENYTGGIFSYYALLIWMVAEALFFPYYFYLFTKLTHSRNGDLEHSAFDRQTRLSLVQRCFEALLVSAANTHAEPERYLQRVIEGWFLDVPLLEIHYDNFAAWTSWAFIGKDVHELTELEVADNRLIIAYVEGLAKWKFPPGLSEVVPTRLTLDPIFAVQRPFCFYATVAVMHVTAHCSMHLLGFRRLPQYDTPGQLIYYRPGTNPTAAKSRGLKPIVFIHGIGVGFLPYMALIFTLPTEVDVFLVEWPHVAMKMTVRGPTVEESVSSIVRLLDDHQHENACFVGHSLGTVLVPWMLRDPRGRRRIASTVLMDPVCFLLCDPTVATKFIYKDPTNALDFLMHYNVSRELFTANALSRHFAWSHNILFVEDFYNNKDCCRDASQDSAEKSLEIESHRVSALYDDDMHGDMNIISRPRNESKRMKHVNSHFKQHSKVEHSIYLATSDSIVPVAIVSAYLEHKQNKEGLRCFEYVLFPGTHGELLVHPGRVMLIANKIRERCGLGGGIDK